MFLKDGCEHVHKNMAGRQEQSKISEVDTERFQVGDDAGFEVAAVGW